MCGLVGMAGFLERKHKEALKDMIFLNTLRGKDSTGISIVHRDRTVATRKMTVPGYEFIEHPLVEKSFQFGDQLWLAHGRYKTYGDVSKANAHPFEVVDNEGDIYLVGAHNGTLENKYELERLLEGEKFDTDSEALFNWLAEAPSFKEAIGKLKGAWSLVWWDPTTDSLHFCRNKERPMFFAWTKDHKVLVWASEAWMLINACRRNGVELLQNDRGLSTYATNEDTLYTLEIPQERDKELPELRREGGYTGAPVKKFQHWYGREGSDYGPNWWNRDKEADEEGEKKAAVGGKETKADGSQTNVVTLGFPDQTRGFKGEVISKQKLDAIKASGCGWCHDKLDVGKVTAFLSEDTLVCVHCMRDTHPKPDGDCVRRFEEGDYDPDLDDDLPFDLTEKGKETQRGGPSENSKEYKQLLKQSVKRTIG